MKETMHFNSFQEMLNFIHGAPKAEELKEYVEIVVETPAEIVETPTEKPKKAKKKKGE